MSLVFPQFIVLDSATLGKVSKDYWSSDKLRRKKSRIFIERLVDKNIYITLTLTHILEVIRHENESVVRKRLNFLQKLPYLAWLRPYDGTWFPGDITDLLQRELHAAIHDAKRGWRAIIDHVRSNLWETGQGSEMFIENNQMWSFLRKEAQNHQQSERYAASVARTDPCNINGLTVAELKQLAKRPKVEWLPFIKQFAMTMKGQLQQHGDPRLENLDELSKGFANNILMDIDQINTECGDPIQLILELRKVPYDLITDDMTVGDIGHLSVYIKQLEIISKKIRPQTAITVHNVPIDTLPSYVLEHKLSKIQRKATRVSGSDLGDGHIAPLVMYADGVEVDKRTHEYLIQVKRAHPAIGELMGHFFRSQDYADIPDLCDNSA